MVVSRRGQSYSDVVGLRYWSQHTVTRFHRRETPLDIFPLRHQWRRLHHQGGNDGHRDGCVRADGEICWSEFRPRRRTRESRSNISGMNLFPVFIRDRSICKILLHTRGIFYKIRRIGLTHIDTYVLAGWRFICRTEAPAYCDDWEDRSATRWSFVAERNDKKFPPVLTSLFVVALTKGKRVLIKHPVDSNDARRILSFHRLSHC